MAVDAGHIYWATGATPGLQATIKEAPLTGSRLPTILIGTGLVSPAGVAVDATHIYLADSGDGTVNERKLTGGGTIPLFGQASDPAGVAVDSGHIYWANSDLGGTINEAPLTGGPVTTLVTGQQNPAGVAVSP